MLLCLEVCAAGFSVGSNIYEIPEYDLMFSTSLLKPDIPSHNPQPYLLKENFRGYPWKLWSPMPVRAYSGLPGCREVRRQAQGVWCGGTPRKLPPKAPKPDTLRPKA